MWEGFGNEGSSGVRSQRYGRHRGKASWTVRKKPCQGGILLLLTRGWDVRGGGEKKMDTGSGGREGKGNRGVGGEAGS